MTESAGTTSGCGRAIDHAHLRICSVLPSAVRTVVVRELACFRLQSATLSGLILGDTWNYTPPRGSGTDVPGRIAIAELLSKLAGDG